MADSRGRPTANSVLLDRSVKHAVYLQRLKTGEVREAVGFLRRSVLPGVELRLAERLSRITTDTPDAGPYVTERLRAVLAETNALLDSGVKELGTRFAERAADLAEYEAAWQVRTLADVVPITVDFVAPSATTLRALVQSSPFENRVLDDWWKGVAADAKVRIEETVKAGILDGSTTQEIVARIRGDDQSFGAFDAMSRNVESTVRTAITNVSNEARQITYGENDDLIKGWQFVATLDARTTTICAGNDGKVFDVGSGPQPPLHWGCRSTTVPVLKSFAELGLPSVDFPASTRASMNGQVAEKTTYDAWLRRQSRATQNEALGPGKADLFRSGVKIERFVEHGRPLSLAELRAQEQV